MNPITLHLNGKPCSIEADACITDLLREHDLHEQPVAVEVNREIIPRSLHNEHQLQPGDKVEIVHAIGGG